MNQSFRATIIRYAKSGPQAGQNVERIKLVLHRIVDERDKDYRKRYQEVVSYSTGRPITIEEWPIELLGVPRIGDSIESVVCRDNGFRLILEVTSTELMPQFL